MLAFPHSIRIYVAVETVDMRQSFNGLWTAASERLPEDPKSGAVFCFINKERTRLKLMYCPCTGNCGRLLYRHSRSYKTSGSPRARFRKYSVRQEGTRGSVYDQIAGRADKSSE